MSLLGKVSTVVLGLGLVGSVSFYGANANVIEFIPGSKTSGSVTLDDNDNVIDASSPEFYKLATNSKDGLKKDQLKQAINYANSRWVFYSDNHNIFTGYKQGHSNYIHYNEYHSSYAAIGERGDGWCSNSAGKYSYSNASGRGTFVAKIDAPYY